MSNRIPRDRPAQIEVTETMIDAGREEFQRHHYDADVGWMLESVYRAMAYASLDASSIIRPK